MAVGGPTGELPPPFAAPASRLACGASGGWHLLTLGILVSAEAYTPTFARTDLCRTARLPILISGTGPPAPPRTEGEGVGLAAPAELLGRCSSALREGVLPLGAPCPLACLGLDLLDRT